ncbi:MAG: esterase [Cellulophaga sp.]|nr:esterase [Cellulophaga sp.]
MKSIEKKVKYTTTNTYETLNTLTNKTKNVWIVFHGIGYLSRYFLKYFKELNPDENYIIAPQAPSKYYLNGAYVHVGASWLTKENTNLELENLNQYLEAVYEAEKIPKDLKLIIFGFSQGVSIVTRWVAYKKLACSELILYAGGIPNELNASDFTFLENTNTKVTVIVGDKDEYLNEESMKTEKEKIKMLFNNKAEMIVFDGKHEVKKELINGLV